MMFYGRIPLDHKERGIQPLHSNEMSLAKKISSKEATRLDRKNS